MEKHEKVTGFTKMDNILLEALTLSQLSGVQKSICLFILRRTAGWGKDEDAISLRDFAEATGSSKSYISEQLKKLINNKVICRNAYQPGKIASYSLNYDITLWDSQILDIEVLHKASEKCIFTCSNIMVNKQNSKGKDPSLNTEGVSNNGTDGFCECAIEGLCESERVQKDVKLKPVVLKVVPKEKLNINKEINIFSPESNEYQLAVLLAGEIKKHLPGFKEPNWQKWAKVMDVILRLDKREADEVKAVIYFCQRDSFWRSNILSPDKLRKQYDQLNAKRLQQERKYRAGPGKVDYREGVLENDSYENFFK